MIFCILFLILDWLAYVFYLSCEAILWLTLSLHPFSVIVSVLEFIYSCNTFKFLVKILMANMNQFYNYLCTLTRTFNFRGLYKRYDEVFCAIIIIKLYLLHNSLCPTVSVSMCLNKFNYISKLCYLWTLSPLWHIVNILTIHNYMYRMEHVVYICYLVQYCLLNDNLIGSFTEL